MSDAVAVLPAVALTALLVAAYFLPTVIAFERQVPNRNWVLALNVFVGWTFAGWVIALLMASSRSRENV